MKARAMSRDPVPAKFGTPLGIAPGNVPAYSSHYPTASSDQFPDRESYRSYLDDIYMGYKWQCVEFARRWLYVNFGYVFDDVAMAYDIFKLRSVRVIRDHSLLPLHSFRNGSRRRPERGCLLVWDEGGEFEHTGHVAIITEVFEDRIHIVEQNIDHQVWPDGRNYSRELEVSVDAKGGHWIQGTFKGGSILGWVMQTGDATHAVSWHEPDPALFNLSIRRMTHLSSFEGLPLDGGNAAEAAYLEAMQGPWLTHDPDAQLTYFCLSETAAAELKYATNEVHAMFMHATHRVLQDDNLLWRFNLPPAIWSKIRQSWNHRRNQAITGRLDFSVSERGIKVFEYNSDSTACYMEAGLLQGMWFDALGFQEGRCPGARIFPDLVQAWHASNVDSVLHLMRDEDPEEAYHALYMKSAAEQAGLRCKLIGGVQDLGWDEEGFVVDADGERILWVWKTWAWETALDQLRAELDEDAALAAIGKKRPKDDPPRLVDVLLRDGVMVFEPLWTLIPSNKAILPVLWELFPDHPYLLESRYELNEELANQGYVSKPIVGRQGANIAVVNEHNEILGETGGQFGDRDQIYQALFRLPRLGEYYVQVGTFVVDGRYSGACVRVDRSAVITGSSDLLPLRILDDDQFKVHPVSSRDSSKIPGPEGQGRA